MALVLICLASDVLLEQVWEQMDQGVQRLRTQSLGHGTTQGTGPGTVAPSHSSLFTSTPKKKGTGPVSTLGVAQDTGSKHAKKSRKAHKFNTLLALEMRKKN